MVNKLPPSIPENLLVAQDTKSFCGSNFMSSSPIQDRGVDHRGFHVCVAEQFLNGSDITCLFRARHGRQVAILEYMRGTRVPEGVTG